VPSLLRVVARLSAVRARTLSLAVAVVVILVGVSAASAGRQPLLPAQSRVHLAPTESRAQWSVSGTTVVVVTIGKASCGLSSHSVAAGAIVFRVVNRSGHRAIFTIGGRRASVPASRIRRLKLRLSEAGYQYACTVAGRRISTGMLRVSAEHRIAVRLENGVGEFYDRVTGAKFVPRGSFYVRIGAMPDQYTGATVVGHTTFNVGVYDKSRAEQALVRMAADGYNVVKVSIQVTARDVGVTDQSGELSPAYVANIVDFLQRAKAHGIYVALVADFIPDTGIYADFPRSDSAGSSNVYYLTRAGVNATARFWGRLRPRAQLRLLHRPNPSGHPQCGPNRTGRNRLLRAADPQPVTQG
jgi:hypothetical protein